jgi:hypothetical protein
MRLILAFGKNLNRNNLVLCEGDIVLSEKEIVIADIYHSKFTLDDFAFDRQKYVTDFKNFSIQIRPGFSNLQLEVFEAHSGNFFNNYLIVLFKWINAIDQLVIRFPDLKIVISDMVVSGRYIPYYEAEGEINRGILYYKYDSIPSHLFNHYTKKRDIKVLKIHSKFLFTLRVFARRYVLLLFKLFLGLGYKFLSLFSKRSRWIINNELNYHLFFLSRGSAHTDYMQDYLVNNEGNSTLHLSEGLFNYGRNEKKVQQSNLRSVIRDKHYVTFSNFFCSFYTVSCLLFSPPPSKLFEFETNGIVINLSDVFVEFLIFHQEVLQYKNSIRNFIKIFRADNYLKKIVLFTGEFYGPYAYITGKVSKELGLPSFQLQNFICDITEDLNILACSGILFYSQKEKQKFSDSFPSQASSFHYWGNIKLNVAELQLSKRNSRVRRVVYFSQPKVVDEEQKIIIEKLIEHSRLMHYKLTIKLHPRENRGDYFYLEKYNIEILDGMTDLSKIANEIDLAVIQTSAVGQQIILLGIPLIISRISSYTRSIKPDYLDINYYGCVTSDLELIDRINNYDMLLKKFSIYRNWLIYSNGWNLNQKVFHESVLKFLNE